MVNFARRKIKKEFKRQVTVYGDYFKKFKRTLSRQTINNIYQVLVYIMTLDVIPQTYMESITGVPGLFEIQVEDQGNIIIGERLKEERLRAGLTQEQLASQIGTKKAYISRVENGHTDMQVFTLFMIFEGLGR